MSADCRDLTIVALADAEAEQTERIRSLEADNEIYQLLAKVAITALHDVTRDRDHLRDQHHRLLDEFRQLRAHLVRDTEAA